MGRTNGKLVRFLKNGLEKNLYVNLKNESNQETFIIDFPRYDRTKPMEKYEYMLKDWYKCNGNAEKYESYSNAKAVFQANLKKSPYLMNKSNHVYKLRYRFANAAEIEENKRKLKEKEQAKKKSVPISSNDTFEAGCIKNENNGDEMCGEMRTLLDESPQYPPSVQSSSSGYSTGEEEMSPIDFSCLEDLDFLIDEKIEENLKGGNIQDDEDLLKLVHDMQNVNGFVEEVNFTSIDVSQYVKKRTYWLCNKKLMIDSTLQLICDKQLIEEGNLIEEGSIIIPNGVWEPGISYDLKKSFEFSGKLYLFLSPKV